MNDEYGSGIHDSAFIIHHSSLAREPFFRRCLHSDRRIAQQRFQLRLGAGSGETRIGADGDDHCILFLILAHVANLIEMRTVEHLAEHAESAFVAEA